MRKTLKLLPLLLVLGLGACAAGRVRTCQDLAGAGWTPQKVPPHNAEGLLALENLPGGSEVIWFSKDSQHELACFYSSGLNNPSCGGTTAYEFAAEDGHWTSRGLRSEVCEVEKEMSPTGKH